MTSQKTLGRTTSNIDGDGFREAMDGKMYVENNNGDMDENEHLNVSQDPMVNENFTSCSLSPAFQDILEEVNKEANNGHFDPAQEYVEAEEALEFMRESFETGTIRYSWLISARESTDDADQPSTPSETETNI